MKQGHGVDITHDNVFLLCYPVSIHMMPPLSTGHPISSLTFDLALVTLTYKIFSGIYLENHKV